MKLYVGNLPFNFSSEDLQTMFAAKGEVTSADVVMDRDTGRSRGFGFVEMADEDGRKAIEDLDGADAGGRRLTVNEARPRAAGGGGGGGRPGGGGGGGGGNRGGGGGGGGYGGNDRGNDRGRSRY
jgi:RNA recognition motif-containing protein